MILDNQLPMGTDTHWHGIQTPNNMDGVAPLTQPLIKSGETLVYEFEAINPEPERGVEPLASRLRSECSTTELLRLTVKL